MSTKMECNLLDQSYTLLCPPDGEELMQMAVQIVDEEMRAILDTGKIRSRERIAVLGALNLAYRLAEQAMAPAAVSDGNSQETATVERLITQLEAILAQAPKTLAAEPAEQPTTPPEAGG